MEELERVHSFTWEDEKNVDVKINDEGFFVSWANQRLEVREVKIIPSTHITVIFIGKLVDTNGDYVKGSPWRDKITTTDYKRLFHTQFNLKGGFFTGCGAINLVCQKMFGVTCVPFNFLNDYENQQPIKLDLTLSNQTETGAQLDITVKVKDNAKNLEYSTDGVNWSVNTSYTLPIGEHTLYARYKDEANAYIFTQEIEIYKTRV